MDERVKRIFHGVEKFIRRLGCLTMILMIVGGILCLNEKHDVGGPIVVAGALCGLLYMVFAVLFWLHVPGNYRAKHSEKDDEKQMSPQMNILFDGEEEVLQKLVAAMLELPSGTEISTIELVRRTFGDDHKFSVDQLIQLDFDVRRAARKAGMRIGNPNKEPVQGGLPFVYDMIIRHGKDAPAE